MVAYPLFKEKLADTIGVLKKRLLAWQQQYATDVMSRKCLQQIPNPHLPYLVQLTNLHTLFEFCIPCVLDYGCALKGNDWQVFFQCFQRLLLFYISCSSKGASDYYRSMLCFSHLLRYWMTCDLPVANLLKANHTVFSEESGEIALSVLVHSQPASGRTDIKETRKYWHLTRQRYLALRHGADLPQNEKASYRWYVCFTIHISFFYVTPV